jgi:hypothetical protein
MERSKTKAKNPFNYLNGNLARSLDLAGAPLEMTDWSNARLVCKRNCPQAASMS